MLVNVFSADSTIGSGSGSVQMVCSFLGYESPSTSETKFIRLNLLPRPPLPPFRPRAPAPTFPLSLAGLRPPDAAPSDATLSCRRPYRGDSSRLLVCHVCKWLQAVSFRSPRGLSRVFVYRLVGMKYYSESGALSREQSGSMIGKDEYRPVAGVFGSPRNQMGWWHPEGPRSQALYF